MLRSSLTLCLLLMLATTSLGFRAATTVQVEQDAPSVRFAAVDLVLTLPAEAELGSYQIELAPLPDQAARVRVVGIEGGEHAAFKSPPFYDPTAIGHERVIIAAYSTDADLPSGTTRIARVHYEITGRGELPELTQLLMTRDSVTTDRDGDALDAQPTLTPSKGANP
jgi:hypothetical protein